MKDKGLINIYILEILAEYSSATNKLHQTDIIHYLNREYNITANRNTISNHIRQLKEHGLICGERGLFLARKFTNIEVQLLLDAIMYSKSIPSKDIESLTKTLTYMAEPEFRKKISQITYANTIEYTDNQKIACTIEKLGFAIAENKQVKITSCRYDVTGELIECGERVVSPYYIISEKGRYYLLCYSGREDIEPRRIDRICNVKILNDSRIEIHKIAKYANHTFRLSTYLQEHIYMYSGEEDRITIRIKRDNIGDFIDWYGKTYRIIENNINSDTITIQIKANTEAVYFWALQYGRIAEVVAPENLRKKIRDGLTELLERYK